MTGLLGSFMYGLASPSESVTDSRASRSEYGVVDRPLTTTRPINLHVDPNAGDDSARGTADAPLATLQEALDRLPHLILHFTRISLADGVYDSDPRVMNSSTHFINFRKDTEDRYPLHIRGNPSDPGQVQLSNTAWTNVGFNGHVPYRTVVEGIQFDGKIQNYGGAFTVQNCRFTGRNVDTAPNAIDGYDGFTIVENCEFIDGVGTAVYANQGHRIYVNECRGDVETVYETNVMGEVEVTDQNNISGDMPDK